MMNAAAPKNDSTVDSLNIVSAREGEMGRQAAGAQQRWESQMGNQARATEASRVVTTPWRNSKASFHRGENASGLLRWPRPAKRHRTPGLTSRISMAMLMVGDGVGRPVRRSGDL